LLLTAPRAHIGPKTIPIDRFTYSESIADSCKQQTLNRDGNGSRASSLT